MANVRMLHVATLRNSGEVLVTGGWGVGGLLTCSEIYDSSTGQWNTTASMAKALFDLTGTLLDSGEVLVIGGFI
ncbi:unnamed protein product, partial [Didymodactylos carnosus]